jgi:hypothetical protein
VRVPQTFLECHTRWYLSEDYPDETDETDDDDDIDDDDNDDYEGTLGKNRKG